MEIDFDPKKASSNPLKHDGVTFDEVKLALLDVYALTKEDKHAVDEHRYITLGIGGKDRILVVVWTLRDDRIRLISAWKANQSQRRIYEKQF